MSGPRSFICLAGLSGAGKDTVGEYLARRHGFERVAIADPLKAVMMTLFQLGPEQLWGEGRNVVDARLGRAPRELYQRFGQVCVELDAEVWLRPFRMRVEALLRAGSRVVCTDLRTAAEWRAARELGASVWLVERPGAGAPGALASHATEREVAGAARSEFDEVLHNGGTLEALHAEVERRVARR
jgi:predicted kinase